MFDILIKIIIAFLLHKVTGYHFRTGALSTRKGLGAVAKDAG